MLHVERYHPSHMLECIYSYSVDEGEELQESNWVICIVHAATTMMMYINFSPHTTHTDDKIANDESGTGLLVDPRNEVSGG